MDDKKLKYDRRAVEEVYATASIADHMPGVTRFGQQLYAKCPFCGEFGKRKSKLHGMKITDNKTKRIHIAKCFDCGASFGSAVAAEEYFIGCSTLEAIERCAATAGVTLEPIADIQRRRAREESRRVKDSFTDRQLKASGLETADIMAKVYTDKGQTEFLPVFYRGGMDNVGRINEDDDDMLIRYIDLYGHQVMWSNRSDGKGLRPYIRIRRQYPHKDGFGKQIKYQTMKGATARFYIPQKIRDLFEEKAPIDTLIIQEGEKKAEKACKHGVLSIGIQGIYNIGSASTGLMKELSLIVRACKVKNVVLLFDSDWDSLSRDLKNGDEIDRRPKQFCMAAIKFRTYVESLHNDGLHVDVWFGHLNSKEEKGIDDLLTGSLAGKEDTLKTDIDVAMHAHDGHAELIDIHKISTRSDYQIRDFWGLNKFADFYKIHSEELDKLDVLKFAKTYYAKTESGSFEAKTDQGTSAAFWDVERDYEKNKTTVTFYPDKMVAFLSANGFKRMRTRDTEQGQFILVRISNGVVTKTSLTEIRIFVAEFVQSTAEVVVYRELLEGFSKIVSLDKIMTLPYVEDTTNNPEENRQVFCYKSGFVAITPEAIDINAPGFMIWEDAIIKRDFRRIPIIKKFEYKNESYTLEFTDEAKNCEFLTYLKLTSNFWHAQSLQVSEVNHNEWVGHMLSKMTAIGYLLHYYKPMNESKCVVAMDRVETEVGNSNGRSGKSLFGGAIEMMVDQATVNGKMLQPQFMFSTVTPQSRNVFIDDVQINFPFDDLFQSVTSDMVVNVKTGGMFVIPREEAPKILITTNHAMRSDSPSANARKHLIGFSDFFNVDRSVADHFGHCFFSNWDDYQWALFDNLMCECVQIYLQTKTYRMNPLNKTEGLIPAPGDSLRRRELRQGMGESFLEWATTQFAPGQKLGQRLDKRDLYKEYCEFDHQAARFCNIVEFKKKLKRFCEYSCFHLNPGRPHATTGQSFIDWTRVTPSGIFIGSDDKSNGVEWITISTNGDFTREKPQISSEDAFEYAGMTFYKAKDRDE